MKKILLSFFTLSTFLFASEGNAPHLDGSELSIFWVIPFVGILLSIAIFPLIAPHFWHHNFGKISAFWAVLFVAPFLISAGFSITSYEILHVGFLEYIPFIILFFLFVPTCTYFLKYFSTNFRFLNTILQFLQFLAQNLFLVSTPIF